jgi:hypothetical protein
MSSSFEQDSQVLITEINGQKVQRVCCPRKSSGTGKRTHVKKYNFTSLLGMESHLGVECQSEIRGKNTNKHEGNIEKEKTVMSSLN